MDEHDHQETLNETNNNDLKFLQGIIYILCSVPCVDLPPLLQIWLYPPTIQEQRHSLESEINLLIEDSENILYALWERDTGKRRDKLERAITCFYEVLYMYTLHTQPSEYVQTQNNLSFAYHACPMVKRNENHERAIVCYRKALHIWIIEAFPFYYKATQNNLSVTYKVRLVGVRRKNLEQALLYFHEALRVSTAETFPRASREILLQLAETEAQRANWKEVQATYATALQIEDLLVILRTSTLDTYQHFKSTFDTLATEIRDARDPDNFLRTFLDAATILRATTHVGPEHTLVYLVATEWGGIAVAIHDSQNFASAQFASLDLPGLTKTFVNTLIDTRLNDDSERIIGGFGLAQISEGFICICREWEGETLLSKVKMLRVACRQTQQRSTLDDALQAAMMCPLFAKLVEQPLASLKHEDYCTLAATFDAFFLQQELNRCLQMLSATVISPIVTWLQKQRTWNLTLIPCGALGTFPLTAVVLTDGRSLAETFSTSVAPSAHSLLHSARLRSPQAGITTLGNPHENLGWSEAEALTLTMLARRAALPAEVYLKKQATRERLLAALENRWAVNVCCHGIFDTHDFLQSALLLAEHGRVTIAEILNHHIDLRGLRLLLLSACQTALFDLQGVCDEVHSLATAMLQAGVQAVIAAQWTVDDKATYLLMVRFFQEWLPHQEQEPPAPALARAQAWLRNVTNADLAVWHRIMLSSEGTQLSKQHVTVRERSTRWRDDEAQLIVRLDAERAEPLAQPYADPYYWAGFQVIGW